MIESVMTPQEALVLLDNATSSIQTNYQTHLKIKQALNVLAEACLVKEKPQEVKKPSK